MRRMNRKKKRKKKKSVKKDEVSLKERRILGRKNQKIREERKKNDPEKK